LFSEAHFGEGIELLTRAFPDWMHPRLRFFAGRENKLPIDQHTLIACIAPRACLLSTALNDPVESVWAIEHTYDSAKRVYEMLGASDALQLRCRWGSHETQTQDIEAYLDWLDLQFGHRHSAFEESSKFYPTYDDWLKRSGESIDPAKFPEKDLDDLLVFQEYKKITTREQWAEKTPDIKNRIEWALGKSPAIGAQSVGSYGSEYGHIAELLSRRSEPTGVKKQQFNFGNYIAGDLYYPESAEASGQKIPAVIWLHSWNNAKGYVPSYRRGSPPHIKLAQAGFAVLAFDQIGTGYRLEEITNFYDRYPQWSLLGKMVADAQSALDVFDEVPFVDANRIYLLGYDMGAKIALHAAAMDDRFAGVVSAAGFTPMRLDAPEKGGGGIARWTHWLPLIPRLGAFAGQERRIPYDYHEVLGLIAPRPVLVVNLTLDLQAHAGDVLSCVEKAGQVYSIFGAEKNLQWMEVEDYNRFSPELQDQIIPKLKDMAGMES
ncbi:MAG: alpha/beta fold hydrolase, partial [Candidatus Omnitrophica bacterium]|nr:alpha/beta fold hydrolase [Candidatus Omnitrophota bacterium]